MLGSQPSQQRHGLFLLGWCVGSSGSMEGQPQPVSVLVQRGDGAGSSPPSPAWEPQLHGNSFWEGEKRNKVKPSPPACAQVLWGFALGEGPAGAQYFHYRRNSPPRQGLIPILPSWPSSPGIIQGFWAPEIKLGPWLLGILSQGLPLFDSLPLLHDMAQEINTWRNTKGFESIKNTLLTTSPAGVIYTTGMLSIWSQTPDGDSNIPPNPTQKYETFPIMLSEACYFLLFLLQNKRFTTNTKLKYLNH